MRKCPTAYNYLRKGRVNLATLALVWRHVTPELLEEIRDKSYRQVQAIVSRFNPIIKLRDVTRPVTVRQPKTMVVDRESAKLGEKTLRRGGKKSSSVEISTPPENAPAKMETVKMHHVNCLLDDSVMQMLDRCKELLSGKHPCGIDLNTLLMELAATWLEKNDPVERGKRREARKKSHGPKRSFQKETSRYINGTNHETIRESNPWVRYV